MKKQVDANSYTYVQGHYPIPGRNLAMNCYANWTSTAI